MKPLLVGKGLWITEPDPPAQESTHFPLGILRRARVLQHPSSTTQNERNGGPHGGSSSISPSSNYNSLPPTKTATRLVCMSTRPKLHYSPSPPSFHPKARLINDPLGLSYPLLPSSAYLHQSQQQQQSVLPAHVTSTTSHPPSPSTNPPSPVPPSFILHPFIKSSSYSSNLPPSFDPPEFSLRKRPSPPYEPAAGGEPEQGFSAFERETSQEGSASGESTAKTKVAPDEEWKAKRAEQNRKVSQQTNQAASFLVSETGRPQASFLPSVPTSLGADSSLLLSTCHYS